MAQHSSEGTLPGLHPAEPQEVTERHKGLNSSKQQPVVLPVPSGRGFKIHKSHGNRVMIGFIPTPQD